MDNGGILHLCASSKKTHIFCSEQSEVDLDKFYNREFIKPNKELVNL